MTTNILSGEIERMTEDKSGYEMMAQNAKNFSKTGAAEKIAKVLVDIAMNHEK